MWQTIWQHEDEDCLIMYKQPNPDNILFYIIGNAYYLIWWLISDLMSGNMKMCEILASIVCDTSLLKSTDYRLKKPFSFKMCERCDIGILEDARHVILQCPFFSGQRVNMFSEIEDVCPIWKLSISYQGYDILHILLGKQPNNITFEEMLDVWLIAGKHISSIYRSVITGRM